MNSVSRLRLAILAQWPSDQKSLAARCGIDNGQLSHYVKGDWAITHTHRAILAHVLSVEPEELDGWIAGSDLWQKLDS